MERNMRETNNIKFGLKRFVYFIIGFLFFFVIDRAAIYLTDVPLAGSFGYTWLLLHHGIQIVLATGIMALPGWHRSISEWGLNFKNSDETRKIILKFTIGWIIGTTIFTLVSQSLSGWPELLAFNLSIENILI